jgi:peroxiredoxin Q/BCP
LFAQTVTIIINKHLTDQASVFFMTQKTIEKTIQKTEISETIESTESIESIEINKTSEPLETPAFSEQTPPDHLSKITGSYATTLEAAFSFGGFLAKAQHQYLILYFYPKDNTPGCTAQSLDLRNHYDALKSKGVTVIGVSRDSLASHHRFAEKLGLPFALLSDPNEELCLQFNVMKTKNMYGKKVRGIQRSTFIFDAAGALVAAWPNVKAGQHIEDVLNFLSAK